MVELPEPQCSLSPTGAHYWEYVGCNRWKCKHCLDDAVLPRTIGEALELTYLIRVYGRGKGYRKWLDRSEGNYHNRKSRQSSYTGI